MVQLKKMERHIPGLAIASAINERLTDLMRSARYMDSLAAPDNNERYLMITEAARRETFVNWPHLDYKWALPDQMAQAGFYYNPNEPGDDRAMCFTCNVCLVSWEKGDEPWSEHERHSPVCPFVKGEYTENVPLAVTYSTCPAVESSTAFNLLSRGEDGIIVCTAESPGTLLHVWSIERLLQERFVYDVAQEARLLRMASRCFNGAGNGQGNENVNCSGDVEPIAVECSESVPPLDVNLTAIATYAFGSRKNQTVPKQNAAWNADNLVQTLICCAVSASEGGVGPSGGAVSEAFLVVYSIEAKDERKKVKVSSLADAAGTVAAAAVNESNNNNNNNKLDLEEETNNKMDIVELNLEDLKKKYNIKNEDRVRDCLMSMIRIPDSQTNNANNASDLFSATQAAAATAPPLPPPNNNNNKSGNSSGGGSTIKSATKSNKLNTLNGITEENEENDLAMFPLWATPPKGSSKVSLEDIAEELKQNKKELMYLANGINLDVSQSPTILGHSSQKLNMLALESSSKSSASAAEKNQKEYTCVPIQCISLASIAPESYVISDVIPSHDQSYVLVVLRRREPTVAFTTTEGEEEGVAKETKTIKTPPLVDGEESMETPTAIEGDLEGETFPSTQLVLFRVDESGLLEKQPHCVQLLFEDWAPLSICMLPGYENDRKTADGFETKDGVFAMTCMDGSLKLVSLTTLRKISEASIEGEKFIAATYCKSLDRICGCTENGSLHFYSFYESDMESGDEHEDHNIPMGSDESLDEAEEQQHQQIRHVGGFRDDTATDARMTKDGMKRPTLLPNENVANFVAYKQDLSLDDLKQAYQLTQFYSLLFPYTGEVPVCWNELIVQKVRRQSQLLKPGEDVHLSKTWRLHRDA